MVEQPSRRLRWHRGQPAAQMGDHAERLGEVTERKSCRDAPPRQRGAGIRRDALPVAEFFRALGEPDLGALLAVRDRCRYCLAGGGEVSFDRAQTIMQGAPSCTFRYKFAPC